ncbi:hypothetical protein GO009_17035 [Muricauda sp. TY007]|uniref:hypothetical protein n=1 Tax=Allomuricauda sp. TY007 TaxID=2683200 RepID=UPI0013BFC027|nr:MULTISPECIES: hypothetical protein [unclassified Allomuricauda]MBA4744713.1 hypothetical protein [Allomuricauda sp.]NDV17724.1 hypothetical protein [Muricauda sp. TY007]
MTKNNLRINKMFPVRLVFLIDILLTSISFVLSYFLCSLILPDIWNHGMLIQLPIIVALTSFIFLFIGIYKGYVKYNTVREVYSIFNAICLANILTIVLVVVNGKLFMEKDLMVPLSIIIVHSILSFSALAISRYLYKFFTLKISKQVQNSSILVYNNALGVKKLKSMISLLEERNGGNDQFLVLNSEHFVKRFSDKYISKIDSWYIHEDLLGNNNDDYMEFIDKILNKSESVYLVNLITKDLDSSQYELTLIDLNKNGVLVNRKLRSGENKVLHDQKVSVNENLTIPIGNNSNFLNQQSV